MASLDLSALSVSRWTFSLLQPELLDLPGELQLLLLTAAGGLVFITYRADSSRKSRPLLLT